jgi:hypothetical protein
LRRSGQLCLADGAPNPNCRRHNMGFFNKICAEPTFATKTGNFRKGSEAAERIEF